MNKEQEKLKRLIQDEAVMHSLYKRQEEEARAKRNLAEYKMQVYTDLYNSKEF